MATKIMQPDPLGIIGKDIIVPQKTGTGIVESFFDDGQGGYYVVVFFGGMTAQGALERLFITPEFLSDAHGVQILGEGDNDG
ncbi:hypothetical protein LCGC14_1425320 [marine sediment metagenome]|uniref:Uncharacterized protein n=1 Tax=marine sediment metagenome TaxID=412755 RepID=A0A0F9KB97_9ZZZZ